MKRTQTVGRDYGFPEDSDSEEEKAPKPQFIIVKKPNLASQKAEESGDSDDSGIAVKKQKSARGENE